MRTESLPMLQAMMAQDTPEVLLSLLKVEHASLAAPILLAYNTETVHRTDGDYLPCPFEINAPTQSDEEIPEVTLTIDNVSLEVNERLRTLVGPPDVTFMVVLASSPDTVEYGPFPMKLGATETTTEAITGSLGQEQDFFTQQVPGPTYLPSNSPGMFL